MVIIYKAVCVAPKTPYLLGWPLLSQSFWGVMNKYYSTANNKKFILLLKIACVKQMERDDMKRNEIKQTNKKAADPRPLVPFIETVDIC